MEPFAAGQRHLSLVKEAEPFQESLAYYNTLFLKGWNDMMAAKLGLKTFEAETDDTLIGELVDILQLVETDMTILFRKLTSVGTDTKVQNGNELPASICEAHYKPEEITEEYRQRMNNWLQSYVYRLQRDKLPDELRRQKMNSVNPKYVLRNYLAQLAIDKAEAGDNSMVAELLELLRNPYDEQPGKDHFAVKRPEWARNRAGCSMLSCSS